MIFVFLCKPFWKEEEADRCRLWYRLGDFFLFKILKSFPKTFSGPCTSEKLPLSSVCDVFFFHGRFSLHVELHNVPMKFWKSESFIFNWPKKKKIWAQICSDLRAGTGNCWRCVGSSSCNLIKFFSAGQNLKKSSFSHGQTQRSSLAGQHFGHHSCLMCNFLHHTHTHSHLSGVKAYLWSLAS